VEALNFVLLALSAFWLGACPFSVWIGRWLLSTEITRYGNGNPGAANVFRAGGRKSGLLAVALDVAKGVPFVFLAHSFFKFPDAMVMAVALSAILGHAFSPLLRLRGGKSVAITFGVLLALPQKEMLVTVAIFMLLGFFFIEAHAWAVMLGPVGSVVYLLTTQTSPWEPVFMLCVLLILAVKHFHNLRTIPRPKVRLVHWLQSRVREG
jgi:glycerol-3-phosphate acyltransferase PlsY